MNSHEPGPTIATAPAAEHAQPAVRRKWWRRRWLWVFVGVGLASIAMWSVREYRAAQSRAAELADLPRVDVSQHDPEMARIIGSARAAVVADPRSGRAWGHFGDVLLAQEMSVEAAICYGRAEQLSPAQVRWPYLRGLCLLRIDHAEAMQSLKRAAQLDDGVEFVSLTLAEQLLFDGELDEAEKYVDRAAQAAPRYSRVLFGKARIAFQRGKLDEAWQFASDAAKAMPPRRDLELLLCRIGQQRGETAVVDEHMALLERLPELPGDNAWDDPFLAETNRFKVGARWTLMSAQELISAGRGQQAVQLLLEHGADKSDNFNTVLLLGRAYLQSGNIAAAKKFLERARSIDPKYPTTHFELGNLAAGQSNWAEAIRNYVTTLECDPGFGVAYLNMGVCEHAQHNSDAALAAFRHACRLLPQNEAAHFELAQLLFEREQFGESRKALDRAAELDPKDPRVQQLRDQLPDPTNESDKP